jgi:MFS family permease
MCAAFIIRGWDQTGSNGANLSFPQVFGIAPVPGDAVASQRNEWIVGIINAGPYLASSLIGCWLTDPLNHYFGRRGTLFWCGIFCTLSVIGSGLAQTWPQLFVSPSLNILLVLKTNLRVLGLPASSWTGNGTEGNHFPCVCRRECTREHPRWSGHVMAALDGIWHLPRVLCQSGSPRRR